MFKQVGTSVQLHLDIVYIPIHRRAKPFFLKLAQVISILDRVRPNRRDGLLTRRPVLA